jgi:hypothetical protein
LTASACTNSTSTIPIVMHIARPPARKQMNIARGRRFSYQQVGAQQLRVQRCREREPEERGVHGISRLAGHRGRRS